MLWQAVISFDIDGAKEVVNSQTGRLIEPQNIQHLTSACAELIADENVRKQLGVNGLNFVKEKFAPKTMVDKIEEVYKKIFFLINSLCLGAFVVQNYRLTETPHTASAIWMRSCLTEPLSFGCTLFVNMITNFLLSGSQTMDVPV
jgi:hypothetical protein